MPPRFRHTFDSTSVSRLAGLRARLSRFAPTAPGSIRGFTLIEMMVVVVLVGILVATGLPAVSKMMRDRRTNQAAHEIALLFRRGRALAMGRGTAVLLRFPTSTQGSVELRQAASVVTVGGATLSLPASSCLTTDWTASSTANVLVTSFDPTVQGGGSFSDVTLSLTDASNAPQNYLDICFTPLGRAFSRTASGGTFASLTQVYTVRVARTDGTGLIRQVLLSPSGTARLAL